MLGILNNKNYKNGPSFSKTWQVPFLRLSAPDALEVVVAEWVHFVEVNVSDNELLSQKVEYRNGIA